MFINLAIIPLYKEEKREITRLYSKRWVGVMKRRRQKDGERIKV